MLQAVIEKYSQPFIRINGVIVICLKDLDRACELIKANRKFVVYPGEVCFPLGNGIEAMGIVEFLVLFCRGRYEKVKK